MLTVVNVFDVNNTTYALKKENALISISILFDVGCCVDLCGGVTEMIRSLSPQTDFLLLLG